MTTAIALDLGTTSIKAGYLNQDGSLVNIISSPAPKIIVSGGQYESDAIAYAESAERILLQCLTDSLSKPTSNLGICCQRSSFLIWNKSCGEPITPLISWQDSRGSVSCQDLQQEEMIIQGLTGLRLTPYYFAPKLRMLLLAHPDWREKLLNGEYLVGTLDTFLIWRWTGGKQFITDASMAARTLLMDIKLCQWSPKLCDIFDIPLDILPKITHSNELTINLDNGLVLQASLGDQSAAYFSSVGFDNHTALVNLGTGGFVLHRMNQEINPAGYLRTLLYQDKEAHANIAIEGTLNSISEALTKYPVNECSIEEMGKSDIYCISEPSGLGAPYFRKDYGMCFSQSVDELTPRQIGCLLLEGIIFRVARILDDFSQESTIDRVLLSGGLSELIPLQQGIAECTPKKVFRLNQKDSSLRGAAMLAAGIDIAEQNYGDVATGSGGNLAIKYQRWKSWLDSILHL
ncbi:MAG: FGGY family carbohydrate kinase [Gallionellaceae bacterium]